MVTVARVNSPHPSYCRAALTVTGVRRYSDGSWWNSERRAVLWRGRHAHVASEVRPPCIRSLAPSRGSDEALIALEAGARARRRLRSRPGLGQGIDCARGQGLGQGVGCARGIDCARGRLGARSRRWLRSRPRARSRRWWRSRPGARSRRSLCSGPRLAPVPFCRFFSFCFEYPGLWYPTRINVETLLTTPLIGERSLKLNQTNDFSTD